MHCYLLLHTQRNSYFKALCDNSFSFIVSMQSIICFCNPDMMFQLIYLFIYLILFLFIFLFFAAFGSSLLHAGFSLVATSRGYSSLQCAGFSLRWLLLLRSTGSRCADFSSCGSWALEHRLSSCGTRAQLFHGMWDLPRPGLEPVSSALAGRFLTTVPPGKPSTYLKKDMVMHQSVV